MSEQAPSLPDAVNHPPHYTGHASGVECIDITEEMGFNLGNVLKYVWRAGRKDQSPIIDLKKAAWYLQREIERLESNQLVANRSHRAWTKASLVLQVEYQRLDDPDEDFLLVQCLEDLVLYPSLNALKAFQSNLELALLKRQQG